MAITFLVVVALPASGAIGTGSGRGGGGESAPAIAADLDYRAATAAVERKAWLRVIARMGNVVARDPKNTDAWNALGHAHRQMGDRDNSFEHYEKALQLSPKHRGVHEYLAAAYLRVGGLAQAEVQFLGLDRKSLLLSGTETGTGSRYSERRAEAGVEPSLGSKGDSYDNALADSINGLYKAELMHRRAPWKIREVLELAALQGVGLVPPPPPRYP